MKASIALSLALAVCAGSASAAAPKVVSQRTIWGFVNPESVGCENGRALYIDNFGAKKLDPAKKEGTGYISKLSLDGKLLDDRFLPEPGTEPLNKPKGIWVRGNRLWVADIDVVWEYDLKTKKGRKIAPPGAVGLNDPTILGNALYVSDYKDDKIYKIEPADFLDAKKEPKVTVLAKDAGIDPNGLYPSRDGRLLIAGWFAQDHPRAIWETGKDGVPEPITLPLGRIDGLYQMKDGSLLGTNWDDGSLFYWTMNTGEVKLATGFKGPADFCVLPGPKGRLTVYAPDLVQSQVRIIELQTAR